MFREMRKKERALGMEESAEILKNNTYGVLSTVGPDGQPYGLPLSYAYRDNAIYIHCAVEGQKLDNMEANSRVSFCVVGQTCTLPEKFSTTYESVIAFGEVSELTGEEKDQALLELVLKYSPDFVEEGKAYIQRGGARARVFKITISHMTGKGRR